MMVLAIVILSAALVYAGAWLVVLRIDLRDTRLERNSFQEAYYSFKDVWDAQRAYYDRSVKEYKDQYRSAQRELEALRQSIQDHLSFEEYAGRAKARHNRKEGE
jgi:predicted Zn-dependent protease